MSAIDSSKAFAELEAEVARRTYYLTEDQAVAILRDPSSGASMRFDAAAKLSRLGWPERAVRLAETGQ